MGKLISNTLIAKYNYPGESFPRSITQDIYIQGKFTPLKLQMVTFSQYLHWFVAIVHLLYFKRFG